MAAETEAEAGADNNQPTMAEIEVGMAAMGGAAAAATCNKQPLRLRQEDKRAAQYDGAPEAR